MGRLSRIAVVLGAGVALGLGAASAAAQTASPEAPPSATPAATPAPVVTPAPTPVPSAPPPSATPAPTAQAEETRPRVTPWPWPFPWIEEGLATPAPTETTPAATSEQASDPQAATPAVAEAGTVTQSTPTHGGRVRGPRGTTGSPEPVSLAGGPAPDGASTTGHAAGDPGTPSAPGATPTPDAYITGGTTQQHVCDVKAFEHGITGEAGAILQVTVRQADCRWGASQVLMAYDIRGPPGVDVVVQSAGGLTVDVEVYVRSTGALMGFGYVGPEGNLIPLGAAGTASPAAPLAGSPAAPAALSPLHTSIHGGDNRIAFVQDAISSSGDAVSGSQEVSVHVEGDARWVRVLTQNAAPGVTATSGDAVSGNDAAGAAGPHTGGAGAQSGQVGDNTVSVDQGAEARSGDAIAGSQVVDIVVTGSVGDLSVLAQNTAPRATATSGNATATNTADVSAGPTARAGRGPAQAGQVGDNVVDVLQVASAITGDAVAGSQVIGILVGGSVGELGVLATNDAAGARATSGDALARNLANVVAGPQALATNGDATTAQLGDNLVAIDQFAEARSGRAVAGGQVIGVQIGGGVGTAALLPVGDAAGSVARSGDAVAANAAGGSLGPRSDASRTALAQQSGSNELVLLQDVEAVTGDAVSGGQVVGSVTGSAPSVPLGTAEVYAEAA